MPKISITKSACNELPLFMLKSHDDLVPSNLSLLNCNYRIISNVTVFKRSLIVQLFSWINFDPSFNFRYKIRFCSFLACLIVYPTKKKYFSIWNIHYSCSVRQLYIIANFNSAPVVILSVINIDTLQPMTSLQSSP